MFLYIRQDCGPEVEVYEVGVQVQGMNFDSLRLLIQNMEHGTWNMEHGTYNPEIRRREM